jgi:hypothetical protein
MGECSTTQGQAEAFIRHMAKQMEAVAEQLSQRVSGEGRTLSELETEVRGVLLRLGQGLVEGLCQLQQERYPAPSIKCECGEEALYQRQRPIQVKSLVGPVRLRRAYYLCAACHHGRAPLDQRLGLCAGGLSQGLEEVLAYVGVQVPFEEAADLVKKLTLVEVAPNSVRAATEDLGSLALAEEAAGVRAAWAADPTLPPIPARPPERLYISMDGMLVHVRDEGWKEVKLGACYTTSQRPDRARPEQLVIRAQDLSFVADLLPAADFGPLLWVEAQRRGAAAAKELIVIGDGASWIWDLATEHFAGATQILDWYHASQYVWDAAQALYGQSDLAQRWAKRALDALWEGKVKALLPYLQKHRAKGEAVQKALTYFTNNQDRMRYDRYRARGLQIGSGSIESGCKHVIAHRLKQAGMRWERQGARSLAILRARLKSDRWDQTLKLRLAPHRTYRPQTAQLTA